MCYLRKKVKVESFKYSMFDYNRRLIVYDLVYKNQNLFKFHKLNFKLSGKKKNLRSGFKVNLLNGLNSEFLVYAVCFNNIFFHRFDALFQKKLFNFCVYNQIEGYELFFYSVFLFSFLRRNQYQINFFLKKDQVSYGGNFGVSKFVHNITFLKVFNFDLNFVRPVCFSYLFNNVLTYKLCKLILFL